MISDHTGNVRYYSVQSEDLGKPTICLEVLTNSDGSEALRDETGKEIGRLEDKICFSEQDLNEWTNFAQIPGGFSEYAAQIPSPEFWPIAVLVDLEIYPEFRKRGHGRAALRQFLRGARTKGAKVALLRVGWYDDNPAGERAWRIAWYAREGFRELENKTPRVLIPFMYRLL